MAYMGIRGEIYSTKVSLENRTYFFNVKENRLGDLYLNIVESKNKETGGFDRQSVVLFADDLQEFLKGFEESLKVMEKTVHEKRKGGVRGGEHSPRGEREEGGRAAFSPGRDERREDDRERKPFDRDRKPFDRDRKPFDRDRKPFDPNRRPFDGDRKPFDRDRKPFDGDRKPFDRDRRPFDGDRKPFDRDRRPFDGDRKPFDRDRRPVDGDRRPFDRDRKPFDPSRKPFNRERKPFERDHQTFDPDRRPFDESRKPYGHAPSGAEGRPFKKFVKTGGGYGGHKRAGAGGVKKGPRKPHAVRAVRRDEPKED
jgi:hypothetical protein